VDADYYQLEIGLKSDFSDAQTYATFANSVQLPDLFASKTYYYRVTARSAAQTVRSRTFSFKTAALPRTITVPGVSNTRDIGGYFTLDGKYQVKQGIFYRGGAINAAGVDTLLNTYGIKTDLDVRGDGSSTTVGSPLGEGVNYVECTGPYYLGDVGINSSNPTYRSALLREIQTCAVKENYPIYLHCSLGRDRTGTLAFLINALLGVGERDLFMDYEVSFFSEAGTRDHQTPVHMVGEAFRGMYNYIAAYSVGGTIQENTEKFMLDLGVTAEEIASIREILLEEVQK
jgi:protein-tyrosine phosphatase